MKILEIKKMNKSSSFFTLVLSLFGIISLYFTPRLLSFLVVAENWYSFVGVLLFVFIFNLFFYYLVFNIMVIIFSNITKDKKTNQILPAIVNTNSSVAILYLTKDDFKESACLSCVNQKYSNFRVFILDDSTQKENIEKIDFFESQHSSVVQIIRRSDKTGFKAGNINHGLKLISEAFDYFIVSDSDGILPDNFITSISPYFINDKIGFVQACCKSADYEFSGFAHDMSPQIAIHWNHFMPYHNKYGFVMFYGHSAMIKTSVWKEVSGFPEVVSEDLAFSSKIRELGYYGIVAEDVWTTEEVPEDYSRFRKRHEKWVRGTTEYLKKNWFPLIRSKKIPWFEKLDLLSSAFSMLMSAPFVLFIVLIAFFLPYLFKAFNLSGAMFNLPIASVGKQVSDYLSGFRYNNYWSLDFYLIVAIGLLYCVIPVFLELWKKPMKFLNHLFISTGIYNSLTVSSTLSIISYLITGKTFFPVTGETIKEQGSDSGVFDLRSNSLKVQLVEILTGTVLIIVSIISHNLWFLPIAIGSILAVILLQFEDYSLIKYLLYLPFIIQLFLLMLIGKNIFL
ncbi:MAG: polysaccharide synthase [uncultured bacterium]|nr:MAG: polysaccharide synthase [uncultured bacterium]